MVARATVGFQVTAESRHGLWSYTTGTAQGYLDPEFCGV